MGQLLADPRTIPVLIALISALTALVRAEAARVDAATALKRTGGRRAGGPSAPPPGQQERRKAP